MRTSRSGSRRRVHACVECGLPASRQCDWKTGKHTTCDAYLCTRCAMPVDENKDLCRQHQVAFREWCRQHPDKAELIGANI